MEGELRNEIDGCTMLSHEDDGLVIVEAVKPRLKPEEAIVTMNGTQFYFDEWNKLFKETNYLSLIRNRALTGGLRSCRFRSICWKVFLHCLPEDQSQWLAASRLSHAHYEELKSRILVNPRSGTKSVDAVINNPLSQEEASPWNQYFQDTDLKLTINQDVIRTFPEIEYFQSAEVREIMVNILFCYAREHPQISYRQGMHELLAPLIFVLHSDQQAYLHADEIDFTDFFDKYQKKTLKYLLDDSFLEHDAYSMFCNMMDHVEAWYLIRDTNPSKLSLLSLRPFARPQDVNAYNIIISKLTYIHDLLLRRHDHDLYVHLEKMEIAPQIYGIRWLRLLFGREFALQDLLVIWDVIFADGSHFGLVDYVFVSMLVYIRTPLLSSDYATCLGYLMRYPTVTDVHYIIDMALHLRDPRKHPKPTGYNHHMLHHIPTVGGRPDIHRAPLGQRLKSTGQGKTPDTKVNNNSVLSGISSLKRKVTNRPKSLVVGPTNYPPTASRNSASEPGTAESPSPTLDKGEYAHVDATDPVIQRMSEELESGASISRSNPALTEIETELKPIRSGRFEEGSLTLPRASGIRANRHQAAAAASGSRRGKPAFADESHGAAERPARHEFVEIRPQKKQGFRKQISPPDLQSEVESVRFMCSYCAVKMTGHIDSLQECILRQSLENEDEMLIALAGMKQVRDILKGTLKFSQNLVDEEGTVDDQGFHRGETNQNTPVTDAEASSPRANSYTK